MITRQYFFIATVVVLIVLAIATWTIKFGGRSSTKHVGQSEFVSNEFGQSAEESARDTPLEAVARSAKQMNADPVQNECFDEAQLAVDRRYLDNEEAIQELGLWGPNLTSLRGLTRDELEALAAQGDPAAMGV